MLKRFFFLLMLLLGVATSYAQQDHHRYEAPLDAVTADGFYKIALKPQITARTYAKWQDIRLRDAQQKQVPYLLEHGRPAEIQTLNFPVIEAARDTLRQYYVVIENAPKLFLDNLSLEIENTEATRRLTLSGSDDKANWYAVREDFFWVQSGSNGRGITFPMNHYRYFKIVFNGAGSLPIKILRATTHEAYTSPLQYFDVPMPDIRQKDSGKYSYATLSFNHNYNINKLQISTSGPKYFHRSVDIGDIKTTAGDWSNTITTEFSTGVQTLDLDFVSPKILLRINNDDNPPIHIDSIRAYQNAQYIIAYLEANKSYTLTFGDSTAQAPVYDLTYFKDSIGKQIPELGLGPIQEINPGFTPSQPTPKDYKWVMWIVIGIVVGGLLYMTIKMLKQMKEPAQE